MANVEFTFNGINTILQSKFTVTFEDIIKTFITKVNQKKKYLYFLYNDKKLNELSYNKTFNQIANEFDRNRKMMNIAVISRENDIINDSSLENSKYIICPLCQENIRISINFFKKSLYECKNGHKYDNISFEDFEKTQKKDESKIKCNKCLKNKSESFQNEFYICLTCKQNLCPLCQNNREDSHNIVDYEKKDFLCLTHFDYYTHYCDDCKLNICGICENEHSTHNIISYGSIMPNIKNLEKDLNDSKTKINELKENIQQIISQLNNITQNIDYYFNIYNSIVHNFDVRNKNYHIIQNINDLNKYNNYLVLNIN